MSTAYPAPTCAPIIYKRSCSTGLLGVGQFASGPDSARSTARRSLMPNRAEAESGCRSTENPLADRKPRVVRAPTSVVRAGSRHGARKLVRTYVPWYRLGQPLRRHPAPEGSAAYRARRWLQQEPVQAAAREYIDGDSSHI